LSEKREERKWLAWNSGQLERGKPFEVGNKEEKGDRTVRLPLTKNNAFAQIREENRKKFEGALFSERREKSAPPRRRKKDHRT